ncbi:MAG TPA: MASE1 domain-containing protein [Alphaproteobacteria bacterium]|nr:MASE1 domain-containing protein [Alphaproteobacteria bacterium]
MSKTTEQAFDALSVRQILAALLVVGFAYFIFAKAGLALASVNPSASPVWPPTGLAVASTLLLGRKAGLAVFVGAWLANQTTTGLLASSLAIACGNTLEALIGALLIKKWAGGLNAFETPANVIRFAGICLVGATPISAGIGVGSLYVSGQADLASLPAVWITWWLGDFTGALIVAPVIVLWAKSRVWPLRWWPVGTRHMVYVATVAVGMIAFSPLLRHTEIQGPIAFLTIVPLLWAALRCTQRETATVALILAGFAVWGTEAGGGPFERTTANESFLLLLMFFISISLPSLVLAADAAVRRLMEERRIAALAEKEVLLREVHHRVKNNLQTIASLIHLGSQRGSHDSRSEFDALAQRIVAIGKVYELVYNAENLTEVNMAQYLHYIADTLRTDQVAVEVRAAPLRIGVDTAIPLGLIAVELATNAVKHAFTTSGTISMMLRRIDEERAELVVADDGIGLSSDQMTPNSTGLQIVRALVGQVGGTLETRSDAGTVHHITFRA